ncbi:MAG TPA: hypothetical protein VEL82_00890 [Thermoplasmata archaeon]|nr:hypothetical protein [Thermoplasmata archaeon]
MRALTEAEARVIAVMLAARPDRERERLRQVEVPRSTYHAVRRRAYEEGWLRDRYVPHPVPLGLPHVTFLVARPYADRQPEFLREVSADAGNVVLWSGSQLALAVLFHARPDSGPKLADRLERHRLLASPIAMTVRADAPTVPVYFDFEGLWCHLTGTEGTLAYPHGLGGPLDGKDDGGPAPLSKHQEWALGELLRRPFDAVAQERGGHLVGPFGLPFSQRKMLMRGWIAHRTLLEPGRLPPYQGRSPSQVVLVSGTPKAGARPELLFSTLTRECLVFPFLFVVGTERWLLAALGGDGPTAAPDSGRRPVLPTLRAALEGIEVLQEPASNFVSSVDHRYDRLLAAAPGSSAPAKP